MQLPTASSTTKLSGDRTVVPLYLDGKTKFTSETFDVTSPITNQTCWASSTASEEDALAAVESAAQAFRSWRKTKPRCRRDIFLRASEILTKRYEVSKHLSHTEIGVHDSMFDFEYHLSIDLLVFLAGIVSNVQGALPIVDGDGSHAMVLKEPYGVVLAVAPWNAPHILGLRACATPLAAGNTVVLKGPELAPATYHNFVDALHEAGLPPGCLNTIYHRPTDAARITKLLIEQPAITKVNFTGSTVVGSVIAGLCGQNLKPCVMELGGKAPAIVCDDADLELAAKTCVFGAFHNSGQICMSTERIIVFATVLAKFRECLLEAAKARSGGNSPTLQLVGVSSAQKNKKLVDDAVKKGAKVVFGPSGDEDTRVSRMHPVIIEAVTPEMQIYATESFGPSVSLHTVETDEEAITLANQTDFGLTSSVFTTNLIRGFKFAREIECGAVHINGATIHDEPVLPHGGVKSSGFGRFNGKDGLEEWVRTKIVTWQE